MGDNSYKVDYELEGKSYPVAYVKNPAGQMAQLHTWRDENGDPDITRWYYDLFTGAVTNKIYADGNGTVYSYYIDGRIASRLWARGVTATYGYTDTVSGSICTTEYSDSTANITNYYNLSGQLTRVEDGTGTTTFGYDSKGRVIAETNDLAVITRSYDTYGRYTGYTLNPACHAGAPGGGGFSIHYSYDIFNRLSSVISVYSVVTNQFNYSYIPGTQLVSGYTASSSSPTNLTVTRTYETARNLITAITNSVGSVPSVVSAFTYSNDSTGKRTSRTDYYNGSTSTNTFGYNVRSEVTNAVMNTSEQSIVFDDIGNREQCIIDNGELTITNLYTANQLNQYSSILNSQFTIPYSPVHDLDGNLTYDGSTWHHTYDAENRLISSTPSTVTNGSVMLEYAYNYKNLRVEKVTKQLSGREAGYPMNPQANPGTWDAIETRKYVWDGFNRAAEIIIDHVTPATNISFYTWGIDLSGSLQGAGGVGGLLSDTRLSSTETNSYYALGDANGNVTEYVDENGTVEAHYEYSATGEETYKSGSMKDDFTHRFSTKPYDPETGLVAYELRYLKPDLTWLSRDPIEERGGINLYGIGGNDLLNNIDILGMWSATEESKGKSRRIYEWESGDTFESLAKELRLDHGEIDKWMKSVGSGKSNNGVPCKVSVPNVIVVFTSKPSWYDIYISVVSHYRRKAEKLSKSYKSDGYKVIFKNHSTSVTSFKSLWKTSGIYGYVYAGHGSRPLGLRINSSFNGAVFPSEVSPPYKLAIGRFYACYSDNKGTGYFEGLGAWKDHLAIDAGAEYLGFFGPAFWWSDPKTENIESE